MSASKENKIAILLSSLPDEQCVEVLKNLNEEDVVKISREMMALSKVDGDIKKEVLKEFHQTISEAEGNTSGGVDYVSGILARVYGVRRSEAMVNALQESQESSVDLDTLIDEIGPVAVAKGLETEHPQVISTVLLSLSYKKAADILDGFSDSNQVEAFKQLTLSKPVSQSVAEKIKRGFTEKLLLQKQGTRNLEKEGVRSSAEILVLMSGEKSQKVMEGLKAKDEEIAKTVEGAMFAFDDIQKLGDRDIQKILAKANQNDLKLAMRKAEEATKEKVFKNMSERAAGMLKDDIEMMGPQKKDDVIKAQQSFVGVIRKLEESGEITFPKTDSGEQSEQTQEDSGMI